MSDTGRESITNKASAALKPDTEKTTTERLGDQLKGGADSVAASAQPQSEKSYLQKASDAVFGNAADKGILQGAKDMFAVGDNTATREKANVRTDAAGNPL